MRMDTSIISRSDFLQSLQTVFHEAFQDRVLGYVKLLNCNTQGVVLSGGDGGKDLVDYNIGRVYACYAPARITDWSEKKLIAKMNTDLAKAVRDLGPALREWIFVHNHPQSALKNGISSHLLKLRVDNPDILRMEAWGMEQLWNELQQALSRKIHSGTSTSRGVGSFRRDLFAGSQVQKSDIFVEPEVQLRGVLFGDKQFESMSAFKAMDQWVESTFESIPAQRNPFVLLGPFGSGKSMLMSEFFARLEQDDQRPVPVAVPLRDFVHASSVDEMGQYLVESIFKGSPYDPNDDSHRFCLLCDGFDELNLAYHDEPSWVIKAFNSLCRLMTLWPHMIVAISSRPILLWAPKAARSNVSPLLDVVLQPFNDLRIAAWCERYRNAAGDSVTRPTPDFLRDKQLLEVARNPLILYMIAEMLEHRTAFFSESRRYHLAEVYRQFVDWTVTHGGFHKEILVKHAVPENFRDVLGEIGWYAFTSGSDLMRESAVLKHLQGVFGEEIDGIPVNHHLLNAHMLQPASGGRGSATPAERGSLIEFTHQSFREYFTAERIWSLLVQLTEASADDEPAIWQQIARRLPGRSEFEFLRDFAALASEPLRAALDKKCRPYLGPPHFVQMAISNSKAPSRAEVGSFMNDACIATCVAYFICMTLKTSDFDDCTGITVANLDGLLTWNRSLSPGRRTHENLEHLLSSLREMRLGKGHLVHHDISDMDLSGAVIHKTLFHQCMLNGISLANARFTDVTFTQCAFWFRDIAGASFADSTFSECRWDFIEDMRLHGGDFSRVNFSSTVLLDPCIEDSCFVGNTWLHARVERIGRQRECVLKRCRLDLAAAQFFSENGVTLESPIFDNSPRVCYDQTKLEALPEGLPDVGNIICLLLDESCPVDLPAEIIAHVPSIETILHIRKFNDSLLDNIRQRQGRALLIRSMGTFTAEQHWQEGKGLVQSLWLQLIADSDEPVLGSDQLNFSIPSGRPWAKLRLIVDRWLASTSTPTIIL